MDGALSTDNKKEKESSLDKLNIEQEPKFTDYAAAVNELAEYLKSENDKLCAQADDLKSELPEYLKSENGKLRAQTDDLKSELAAIRSSTNEQHFQCQMLLMEENKKHKELSEEISKIPKLELQECSSYAVHEEIESEERTSLQDSSAEGAKKRKLVHLIESTANAHADEENGRPTDYAPLSIQQPACCQIKFNSTGGDATDNNAVYCLFQCLLELVLGMKFSPYSQSDKPCIQALHQSSGYSFTLTWVRDMHGEANFLYCVLSLGTFERAAPEWMRETIMFSPSMCRTFFERVNRFIKC